MNFFKPSLLIGALLLLLLGVCVLYPTSEVITAVVAVSSILMLVQVFIVLKDKTEN